MTTYDPENLILPPGWHPYHGAGNRPEWRNVANTAAVRYCKGDSLPFHIYVPPDENTGMAARTLELAVKEAEAWAGANHVTQAMTTEHAHADQYASLRAVLDAAYAQAADGKGQERHASDGQAFEDQPIMTIARRRGLGFLLGQADKKTQEAQGMAERGEHDAAVFELHGAINYLAAAVLLVGEAKG